MFSNPKVRVAPRSRRGRCLAMVGRGGPPGMVAQPGRPSRRSAPTRSPACWTSFSMTCIRTTAPACARRSTARWPRRAPTASGTGCRLRRTGRAAGWRRAARSWWIPSGETVLTGACLDVTAQVRAEEELAARLRQQELVAEIGQYALEVDDLTRVFDHVVRRIAEVLDVDYAKVLELQADRKALLLRSGVGWRDGLVGTAKVGTELDSQAGYTLMVDAPVVVEDLSTDDRFRGPQLLEDHGVVQRHERRHSRPGPQSLWRAGGAFAPAAALHRLRRDVSALDRPTSWPAPCNATTRRRCDRSLFKELKPPGRQPVQPGAGRSTGRPRAPAEAWPS